MFVVLQIRYILASTFAAPKSLRNQCCRFIADWLRFASARPVFIIFSCVRGPKALDVLKLWPLGPLLGFGLKVVVETLPTLTNVSLIINGSMVVLELV